MKEVNINVKYISNNILVDLKIFVVNKQITNDVHNHLADYYINLIAIFFDFEIEINLNYE